MLVVAGGENQPRFLQSLSLVSGGGSGSLEQHYSLSLPPISHQSISVTEVVSLLLVSSVITLVSVLSVDCLVSTLCLVNGEIC